MFRQSALYFSAPSLNRADRPLAVMKRMLHQGKPLEMISRHFQDSFFPLHSAVAKRGGPALASYAQSAREVPELTSILMKVCCDTKQLDRLRFIFALAMKELDYPSLELFNVYLIALSQSDAVLESEVQNVEEMMATAQIPGDVVTALCLTELWVKLGRSDLAPINMLQRQLDEYNKLLDEETCLKLPVGFNVKCSDVCLLLFTTSGLSRTVSLLLETCYRVNPLPVNVLVEIFLQSSRDDASSCSALLSILLAIEKSVAHDDKGLVERLPHPVVTRLLLKCARHENPTVGMNVLKFAVRNKLVTSHSAPTFNLYEFYFFVQSDLHAALVFLETHPDSLPQGGEERSRLAFGADGGPKDLIHPLPLLVNKLAALTQPAFLATLHNLPSPGRNTLNLFLSVSVHRGDDSTEEILMFFQKRHQIQPDSASYRQMMRNLKSENSEQFIAAVKRFPKETLADQEFLAEALLMCCKQRNIEASLSVVNAASDENVSLPSSLLCTVLSDLSEVIDVNSIRLVFEYTKRLQISLNSEETDEVFRRLQGQVSKGTLDKLRKEFM